MTTHETTELLIRLASTPSVSGSEKVIADFLQSWMEAREWQVERVGNSVVALNGPGPYLLLNSHLDTVPECDGWTRDPYQVEIEEDRLYGLGTNDAKGAGTCLLGAFDYHVKAGTDISLAIAIVEGEETTGIGMTTVLEHFRQTGRSLAAAIVGEPTSLEVAVAQKGLLILDIVSSGTPCHAARARENEAVNPIGLLARDIQIIESMTWDRVDPFLGPISMQPTMLQAGTAKNQIPGVARATFDVRTTNAYTHDEVVDRISQAITGDIDLHSDRLVPVGTDEGEPVVQAALKARPGARAFGSATMSDMVFLKGVPAVKVGPGKSPRSHTPDEFILLDEIEQGLEYYRRLVAAYGDELTTRDNLSKRA